MVGLGIRVTTGFQQVRVCLSGTTKLKNYSTFNETLTCPVSPVDG